MYGCRKCLNFVPMSAPSGASHIWKVEVFKKNMPYLEVVNQLQPCKYRCVEWHIIIIKVNEIRSQLSWATLGGGGVRVVICWSSNIRANKWYSILKTWGQKNLNGLKSNTRYPKWHWTSDGRQLYEPKLMSSYWVMS